MKKPIKKTLVVKFMKAYSLVMGTAMEDHCKTIDIAEQDACDPIDRTFFNYYDGISVVYDYTKADPFWQSGKIRTPQNVRNSWKKNKIPTDMLIYE